MLKTTKMQNDEGTTMIAGMDGGMDNRTMAATLFNIAAILKREGNKNPYRTEAYERCARALMGMRGEARQIVGEKGKVPFGRRQRIGTKLQAKIREMAQQGGLAQFQQALGELPPHFRELMAVPGVGIVTAERLYAAGIRTRQELARAASDGRLRHVAGFGEKRIDAVRAHFSPERNLFDDDTSAITRAAMTTAASTAAVALRTGMGARR